MEFALRQVNRQMAMLQIVAANAVYFANGYSLGWNSVTAYYFGNNAKSDLAAAIRAIRRHTNGRVEKVYTDTGFKAVIYVVLASGDAIHFSLSASRESVCTKVVTGKAMVEEIDYESAPKRMVERDIVEWQCDSILEGA